jgi:tetratricopeptide (TPR) repeat protein
MNKIIIILTILFSCNYVFLENIYGENPSTQKQAVSSTAASAEYLKLRLDYSKSPEYNPYNIEVHDIMEECYKLMDEGKSKEAIEKAKIGLQKDKYNIQLLIVLASAYRKVGDIENADKYRKLWVGLMNSILTSGDGKSAKSAFAVISVDEEYAALEVLQLIRISQRYVVIDGANFDILEVKKEKTDGKFDLYFNINIPFNWLSKSVSSK